MTDTAPGEPHLVLGIDGGTEALKAGVFDLLGRLITYAAAPYPTRFPQPGWAEQDPADWWTALGAACRRCLADLSAAGYSPDAIVGVSADATTCTLLPLDDDGQPLAPAFLWMDVRAADQAQRIFATGHPALRYSPAGVSAEWMPSKALWLKEHRPDLYARTRHFVEYTDWLALRLTGRVTLNLCTATQRWFYHRPSGGSPGGFFAAAGLADVLEKVPAEVLPLGAPLGSVTAEAAAHTGLPEGTPVFTGGGDAPVCMLGLDVVRPGQMALVIGSSTVLLGVAEQPLHAPGIMGSFADAVVPGQEVIETGQVSTGSVVSWFRKEFAPDLVAASAEGSAGVYRHLDAEAAKIPPGSEGLVVLESFQGNRSPYADALARGAIWGLSLRSTRAHVYRAILEGIAYGTRHILDVLARHGYQPAELVAAGGATRSRFFMQLYADVCGLPIRTTTTPEATLLGSAIVAAVGASAYPSFEAATREMVQLRDTFEPDVETHRRYAFWVEKYAQTYERLRDLMHEMSGETASHAARKSGEAGAEQQ